jgi:uncharacterized membrane protein
MSTLSESWSVTADPVWPWTVPGIGLWALILVALALIGLTVWTYRGVQSAHPRRVLTLIGLRLAALLVACLMALRPSLAVHEELRIPSMLVIAGDASESMTIRDQFDNQSRWDYLRRTLRECEPQLRQLRDEFYVTIAPYRFAESVGDFDPEGKADGKRTDFGEMLNNLYERHGSERNLRGLLVLSDGADNGTRYPALALAAKWRTLPCPIHTFAFGKPTTSAKQRDIALTAINPEPSPVAVKGKLTVRGTVDAPGFENATVRVHLLLDGKEVLAQDQKLPRTTGNEIRLACDAPATAGEVRVTLKIEPLPGEMSQLNNEISTYLTVTKEGLSVLYVEGKYRAWEPKFIREALSADPSIRLFEAFRLTDEEPTGPDADLFQFEKQHYDVIILGDVTARRLSGRNPKVLEAIYQQVFEKGAGLLMIGGYESFGNSDWSGTPVANLLPVQLNATGQVDRAVQMVPTRDGLNHYLLRLMENLADNAAFWAKLPKLEGMTKLGTPKPAAITLAQSPAGEPILVGQMQFGNGRTLAFAGDTTWRWRRTPEGVRAHARFWQQVVLWLAKRDQADGNILVTPDTRRLAVGGKLGFTVKLRGKGGVDIPEKDAHFDVAVVGPDQIESKLPTAREHGDERGTFWKTELPGEYTLVARGWGTDVDGKELKDLPPAKARFMIYQDDAEMSRQAADHEFLAKLANAGGGKFHQAEELKQFLKDYLTQPLPQNKPKAKLWPDWRRNPASQLAGDQMNALTHSGILACFLLFVSLLCLEWFFRRRWGLV